MATAERAQENAVAESSIRLPRVVVTATAADILLEPVPEANEPGAFLDLYARANATSSESFVRTLVAGLRELGYEGVRIWGSSTGLQSSLVSSLRHHGMRFEVRSRD